MNPQPPVFDGSQPCRNYDWRLWFTDVNCGGNKKLPQYAKRVCGECPFRLECFRWAYVHHEWGIWGGTTTKERAKIRRQEEKEAAE